MIPEYIIMAINVLLIVLLLVAAVLRWRNDRKMDEIRDIIKARRAAARAQRPSIAPQVAEEPPQS